MLLSPFRLRDIHRPKCRLLTQAEQAHQRRGVTVA